MSLILEALRKLEREAPSDETRKTVVLLAPLPSGQTARGARRRWLWWLGAGLLLVAVALALVPLLHPPARLQENDTSRTSTRVQPEHAAAPSPGVASAVAVPLPTVLAPRLAPATPPPVALAAPTAHPAPSPRYVLSAIGERDGRPIAMLNDQIVHEGDRVDGAVVRRISEGVVEIEVDGHTVRLVL
jgi:hypothetical protein